MENPKKQLLERLKTANNVLVTVSTSPSVDQLSAAIGFTLLLNKMGKHATAVFSGEVPSTIEFLQPEKTLEKNTDSLRDFIIALDKSKADKLRYKVEDSHVKIFITPYRTSLSENDLVFSQGDFNVEVVVALGVNDQKDLDHAITAHGRILHDATTISMTNQGASSLGSINWVNASASSLCEMVASLADSLQQGALDGQMATALMTGIVAETDRFSNEKTNPDTMSISAKLMAAGANQQLVASKLQETQRVPDESTEDTPSAVIPEAEKPGDGSLQIDHQQEQSGEKEEPIMNDSNESEQVSFNEVSPETHVDEVQIDEEGNVKNTDDPDEGEAEEQTEPSPEVEMSDDQGSQNVVQGGSSLILEPPTLGGKLTANSEPEHLDPATDPLGMQSFDQPLLSHDKQEDTPPETDTGNNDEKDDRTSSVSDNVPPTPPELSLPELPQQEATPSTADSTEPKEAEVTEESFTLPVVELPEVTEQASQTDISEVSQAEETTAETFSTESATPPEQTLSELEAAVMNAYNDVSGQPQPVEGASTGAELQFPTVNQPVEGVDNARDAVSEALSTSNQPLEPIAALNAQPLDLDVQPNDSQQDMQAAMSPNFDAPNLSFPESLVPPTGLPEDVTAASVDNPTAPPTVPPPLPPNMYGTFDAALPEDAPHESPLPPPSPQDQSSEPPQTNAQNPFNLPPA